MPKIDEYLRYGDDRQLDMSMTSIYSTPRHGGHHGAMELNDSQMEIFSNSNYLNHNSGIFSPHLPPGGGQRRVHMEGRVNS